MDLRFQLTHLYFYVTSFGDAESKKGEGDGARKFDPD